MIDSDQKISEEPRDLDPQDLDPQSFVFENVWVLRAHFESNMYSYKTNYIHLMDVSTIGDWVQMLHSVDVTTLISQMQYYVIYERAVTSLSLFKQPVLPEWENEHNHHGYTLSYRGPVESAEIANLWKKITCDLVREGLDDFFLGVQISKKWIRKILSCKLDVWMSQHADVEDAKNTLCKITGLTFTNVPRTQ